MALRTVIIIIIIILVTNFMHIIYNYILETIQVCKVYIVAAVLYLYFSTSRSFVQCPVWLFFCSSLISCFPGTLLRYCLSGFEIIIIIIIIIVRRKLIELFCQK